MRPEDRDRLRPDGLMDPDLPPLTVCGGVAQPYLVGESPFDPTSSQPKPSLAKPFAFSEQTGRMLAAATPAQREDAIRIAAKLLAIKARKRAAKG